MRIESVLYDEGLLNQFERRTEEIMLLMSKLKLVFLLLFSAMSATSTPSENVGTVEIDREISNDELLRIVMLLADGSNLDNEMIEYINGPDSIAPADAS